MCHESYFDTNGRRVARQGVGTLDLLSYIYSGMDIIYKRPLKGIVYNKKHFYANSLHIAENSSGTVEYYHQDHLGSTRLKTNSTGGKIFNRNYKPFGLEYGGSGQEEFKYTGKHQDLSGLYYFGRAPMLRQ